MQTNCTDTEIQRVLNKSLILIPYPDNNSNNQNEVEYIFFSTVVECIDICSFCQMTFHFQKSHFDSGDIYNVTAYVVDAVWALAHALNNCISTTNEECSGRVGNFISNFSVNNEVSEYICIQKTVCSSLKQRQVNFINGDRQASTVVVQQYQNKGEVMMSWCRYYS